MLVVFLTALTAVSVLKPTAEQIVPPEIYVPDESHFKLELSLPSEVNAGTSFTGSVYIKRFYTDISDASSISGSFVYDSGFFAVTESSQTGEGYTLNISKSGFSLIFDKPASSEELAKVSFSVDFTAQKRTSNDEVSIDRVYITLDHVSVVSASSDIYEGIGAIGYTEFIFAKDTPPIELPPVPFDESSDNVIDNSKEEVSDFSEPYSEEPSSEEPSEEYSEVISEEPSEEPSDEPSSPAISERLDELLSDYGLTVDNDMLFGFKPNVDSDEIMEKYPEITIIHFQPAASVSNFVSTQDILLFFNYDGTVYKRFTCVVKGDVDGNGKINSSDYIAMRLAILKKLTLSKEASIAADLDDNGKINSLDYIRLRMHILKIVDIHA